MAKLKAIRRVSYKCYPIPAIIITGKFLTQFGFLIGCQMTIDYQPGRIVINQLAEKGGGYAPN